MKARVKNYFRKTYTFILALIILCGCDFYDDNFENLLPPSAQTVVNVAGLVDFGFLQEVIINNYTSEDSATTHLIITNTSRQPIESMQYYIGVYDTMEKTEEHLIFFINDSIVEPINSLQSTEQVLVNRTSTRLLHSNLIDAQIIHINSLTHPYSGVYEGSFNVLYDSILISLGTVKAIINYLGEVLISAKGDYGHKITKGNVSSTGVFIGKATKADKSSFSEHVFSHDVATLRKDKTSTMMTLNLQYENIFSQDSSILIQYQLIKQ